LGREGVRLKVSDDHCQCADGGVRGRILCPGVQWAEKEERHDGLTLCSDPVSPCPLILARANLARLIQIPSEVMDQSFLKMVSH
jgi:hypothetical protein